MKSVESIITHDYYYSLDKVINKYVVWCVSRDICDSMADRVEDRVYIEVVDYVRRIIWDNME